MEKLIIAVEGETDKTIFSKFMKDLPLSLISQISIKEFNGFSGVMKSLNENTIFGIVDNDKAKQIILNELYERINHQYFFLKAMKTDEIKDVLILNPAPEKILFQEAIGCNITIQDFFPINEFKEFTKYAKKMKNKEALNQLLDELLKCEAKNILELKKCFLDIINDIFDNYENKRTS